MSFLKYSVAEVKPIASEEMPKWAEDAILGDMEKEACAVKAQEVTETEEKTEVQ